MIAEEKESYRARNVFLMRGPCQRCRWERGYVTMVNGQAVVRCEHCNHHCYNQPRTESGNPQRSVRSGATIPSKRYDIFSRDGWRCVICGRSKANDVILHIDHAVGVKAGLELGLTEEELNSDENLITLCEECNLGKGQKPIELRLLVAVMKRRRWPA
jgi:5-methylcytosine-specific restriction endonuclease McrA